MCPFPGGSSHCATSTTNGVINFKLWSFEYLAKMYLIGFPSLDLSKEGVFSDYWAVFMRWYKKEA